MPKNAKIMIEQTAQETRISGDNGDLKIVVRKNWNKEILITKQSGGYIWLSIEEAKALRIAIDYELDRK